MRAGSRQDQSMDSLGEPSIRPNQRQIMVVVLKWVLTATLFGIITFFTVFGIDFNTHVSLKEWISPVEILHEPLSDCFSNYKESLILKQNQKKKNGIMPSVPVVEEFTCYDFASTLKPNTLTTKTLFHTFWPSKLLLDDKHIDTIRSFLATQNLEQSQLVIWMATEEDKDLVERQTLWKKIPQGYIQLRVMDTTLLVKDTPLENMASFNNNDDNHVKDLVQVTSLYKYGGVWFDMEVLFVRDMSPLLTQEWISEGGCKTKDTFNGAFVHFFKQSHFLCEVMSQVNSKKSLAEVYRHIYYRLLENKIEPWSVLPWCYTDPSNCLRSNSLPSAFESRADFSKSRLQKTFAYHWHPSFWSAKPGALYKYLVNQHKNKISF